MYCDLIIPRFYLKNELNTVTTLSCNFKLTILYHQYHLNPVPVGKPHGRSYPLNNLRYLAHFRKHLGPVHDTKYVNADSTIEANAFVQNEGVAQ